MKITKAIILIITLLYLFPFITLGQGENKANELNNLMDDYYHYKHFNGTVLVAEKGQIILKKAYGFSNFELETENTLDTKFRIASITKEITAVLVMQEVEKGNITLDSKISDYLLEFPKEIGNQVTIHHLLSHSSGILDFPDISNFDVLERKPHSFDDLVNYFKDKELLFEPGSQFRYSNLNYVILVNILEKVSGKSYNDLMQKRIFDPVGMNNSGIDDNITFVKNRAQGYYHKFLSDGIENATYLDMSVVKGAGDIYSTVEDLFKFDLALTNNLLISAESLSAILTPNKFPNMQFCGYGWDIRAENWGKDGEATMVTGGAGSINGFKSNYRRFDNGNCIILLSNFKDRSGTSIDIAGTQEIINDIAAILYNRHYNPPLRSGVGMLGKILVSGHVDSLSTVYDKIKETPDISFNRNEILDLCYYFLDNDDITHMQSFLRIKLDSCFTSAIDLSQLAAFYFISGNKQKAEELVSQALMNNEYAENLLIYTGYLFLNRNHVKAALYLFESNIEYFPEVSNAYDSYAEALLKNGQEKLALKNYEKSLELDPDNMNAKEMIKKINE